VTGFDREIGVCLRVAESNEFLKTFKNSSANKIAQLVPSPFEVKDVQFAYALA